MPSRVLRESHRSPTHDRFKAQESLTYQGLIHNNCCNDTAFLDKLTLSSMEAKENSACLEFQRVTCIFTFLIHYKNNCGL